MLTDQEFTAAAERYMDMSYRIAVNYLGRCADAEDAVQNTMLRLCRTDTAFDGENHLRHWIIHVTLNECRRLAISFWRTRALPLDEGPEPTFSQPERQELYDAVMSLPRKYRLPLYLYYYEDYSVAEIADVMGLKPSTVQTRLSRAREKLKAMLTEE